MGIFSELHSPADVKALDDSQLAELADEIREVLVEKVSATGGHLGPNLGVVELTLALHRVFESPHDPFIFDTSHQSYVHKMLTGRLDRFDTLRQKGGLSGYTSRAESEHDWTESSHASSSLSYADGLAKGLQLNGLESRNVVAVVGDGALTGGMCWEALNNIAEANRNVVIVVNDNGRSYSPTIGGFAKNLSTIRMQHGYDELMEHGKRRLQQLGWVGRRAFEALAAFKEGVKSQLIPTEMFADLGLKYVGPISGHDLSALIEAFEYAQDYDGPIIVHAVTEKGHGFAPAVNNLADQMHSTGSIDPVTGTPKKSSKPGWTKVFSDELVDLGHRRDDIVAITAAMAGPTGLQAFADEFPRRFFDVGIAEAHALTSAAGLALSGRHPVVALYSTFLNRGFDQLLMDVGLLKLPVTLVLDRSGVTGTDGASHNGVWDLAIASIVPGIKIAAPRDGERLRQQFAEAVEITDGPSVVRFPKGELPETIDAEMTTADGVDILSYGEGATSVLFISVGAMAPDALAAAEALADKDIAVTVVDPQWVFPVADSLIEMARDHDLVVVAEDGIIRGGIGSAVGEALAAAGVDKPLRQLAFPHFFPLHASRSELLHDVHLDAESMRERIENWVGELAQPRGE
ncbi:1-deoxy-D-xylulose-5-phosphate synthase [Corynebacterium yudongzhengii]|uniref:1-deoxy-D-xylulose-5-phosphate synthase n=1 Tax=Corynebacterium yudongzhengii TaxID=2080740 RepID=A0A2U1T4W0_9CORY|nr:1-deoxy-D-xylulose-5-phosphate synthase [Corynebacterium yudongzhengii]AWB81781.1 1-deoxy-D-xylulose-5-phosphate synthase [Corynebacterium yudongzhengii]PWC01046.1 1-deoxy-D-xylulose-5-phosphate synthase [Corynebacterium yudongzhengii]